jgi:PAS domain S-box-containing protein
MHDTAEPSGLHPLQTILSPAFNQAAFNQMKLALAHIQDAIAWVNPQGQIEWCNPAFDRLPQLAIDRILSAAQSSALGVNSKAFSECHEIHQEIRLTDCCFWLKMIHADGTMLVIRSQKASHDDCSPPTHLPPELLLPNPPEELLQPEARLQLTLDYTNVGSWIWDITSGRVALDKNAERLLGLVSGTYQPVYKAWRDCVYPEDIEGVEQSMTRSLATASDINVEYRAVYSDGSLHWLGSRGRGVRNQAGEWVQVMGLIIDITDRKQIELALAASQAQLQQQQEFLRQVIDTNPNLLFVKDAKGKYVLANQAIADFHNLPIEELLAKALEDFCSDPERAALFRQQNQWVIDHQQGMFIAEEQVDSGQHQGIEWLQWQKQPIWLPDRQEYGVLGIGVNISDRKRTEAALKTILQGTAFVTGEDFFLMLVQSLVSALGVYHVGIAELKDAQTLDMLAWWSDDQFQPKVSYSLPKVPPCVQSIDQGIYVCSRQVRAVFPNVEILERAEAESYLGVAMYNTAGIPIGVLCILDTKPIADIARTEALMRIFAARAATELERQRSTTVLDQINQELKTRVAQRTQELAQFQTELQKQARLLQAVLDNVGDGLIVADLEGRFLVFNPAAERILGIGAEAIPPEAWVAHYGVYISDRLTLCPFDQLPLIRAIRGEAADNVEIFIRNSQKPEGVWIDTTIRPFYDQTEQIAGGIVAFRDVTQKKAIDEALRQREQEFRTLVENSPDLIIRFDRQNRYRYVNPRMEQETGILAAEFIGKTPSELGFPELLTTCWTETIERTLATSVEQALEYEIDLLIGKQADLARFIPEFDSEGRVQSVLVVVRHITDLKRAEASLRESETRLRAIFENAPLAIGLVDIHTHRHVHYNAAHSTLFGYGDDEIADLTVETITHPDDIDADLQQVQRLVTGEIVDFKMQKRYIRKNGELLWGNLTCALIRDAKGEPIYLMGMVENINDRKQTEHKLLAVQEQLFITQERLHHLLSSSPGIIYAATPGAPNQPQTLTFISTNVMQILGYESQECLENDFWLKGIHPDDRSVFTTAEQEMLHQGYATCEYRFRHKNGSYRWLYDQTKLVQDEWGNPLERIGSWMDISDRKAAEAQLYHTNAQLAQTNAELARATRLKDEFLANMSHELRTPLNSILGLSEVMQEGAFGTLTDKQRQFLIIIQSSGKHLLALINDVLDLAKIEAGMLDLLIAETSIHSLCEVSLTMIQQQAHQKNISLVCLTEDLGTLQVDERRMRQVLLNLLSNAVKFTPEGGRVTLEVEGDPTQNSLSFSITDTGIGIAPEDISKLFQTFVQLDSSLSRHYEGTGLGLVLVKQIVELHGGQITVSSEVGRGSCFRVTLPWKTPQSPSSWSGAVCLEDLPEPQLILVTEPRILLAEDDLDGVATLTDYLQMRGFQMILAHDSAEAVQKAIAQSPHLVLIDVQMLGAADSQAAEIDGLEAIRQIRSHLKQVPIIALTSLALPGEQEKCHLAGANDYLVKPVRLKQLVELIQRYLEPALS